MLTPTFPPLRMDGLPSSGGSWFLYATSSATHIRFRPAGSPSTQVRDRRRTMQWPGLSCSPPPTSGCSTHCDVRLGQRRCVLVPAGGVHRQCPENAFGINAAAPVKPVVLDRHNRVLDVGRHLVQGNPGPVLIEEGGNLGPLRGKHTPPTADSVNAAAGTINPATRAPQRTLTPRKARIHPSVIPVARNRPLAPGPVGEVQNGTREAIRVSGSSSSPASIRFHPTRPAPGVMGFPPQPRGTPGEFTAHSQQKPVSPRWK